MFISHDYLLISCVNQVDLGNLLMNRQLSMLVIGQDVLKTKNEVIDHCLKI